MWRSARVLWPTGLAVIGLAGAAWSADPGDPKGPPAGGGVQRPPRPQGIDPARVDLKRGFRAHQIVELQQAIDRVTEQITELQRLLAELQQQRAKEIQHKREVVEYIARVENMPGPNGLPSLESDLKQTEDRIALLDLRIAAAKEKLDARKVERRNLEMELREARTRQDREERAKQQETQREPSATPSPVPHEAN